MEKRSSSRVGRKPRFDAKRRVIYIDALSQTGIISEAMKACGISSRSTLKNARDSDPGFAAAEQEALDTAADLVELALHKRSLYGHEIPVVDEMGRSVLDAATGEPRTTFLPPDNKLLLARAKALKPEKYATERRHVSKSGTSTMVIMPASECEVEFEKMLAAQKEKTEEVLQKEVLLIPEAQ